MDNLFKVFNNIFKKKDVQIYPTQYIGNRKRSQTEYNFEDYQDMLQTEFKRKMEYKRTKKDSSLRIRGSSF